MSRVQFVGYQLFSPGFKLRLLWRKLLWGESEIKSTAIWIAGVIRFGTIDSSVEIYITIGKNTRDLFLGLLLHILYRLVVNFYLFRVLSASNPFQALRTQGLIIWSICKHYDCVVTNIQKWTMIYSTNLLDLLRRVWWDRLAWFVLCTSFFNPNFTRPVNIFGSNILSVLNKLHVFWRLRANFSWYLHGAALSYYSICLCKLTNLCERSSYKLTYCCWQLWQFLQTATKGLEIIGFILISD